MAENEILDVGNPRHYQRWRRALADANLNPSEIADCLFEDLSLVLRKKLRGKPLYLILKACSHNSVALQKAVANFKDRAMAKLVEQAYALTRSNDPQIVAGKIAELLVDRLVDRANRHAFKHCNDTDGARHASLERAASAKLEASKPEIVGLLAASLRGEPVRPKRSAPTERPSANSLLAKSLLPHQTKRPGELPHA